MRLPLRLAHVHLVVDLGGKLVVALELRRVDEAGYVDVELPRTEYLALRDRLGLKPGSAVHLRPRKVTRFAEELTDPAAMI